MLGPLAEESPRGREIGRLRTRGVREIGEHEGPGSGRSSGLPPRALFFPPSPKQMGSESAQVLKICYVPTLLVLWGRNRVAGPPFSAVFKVQRRFPRNLLCSGDSPPGSFGAFPDRRTRRVSRPRFRGDEEVGNLRDPAKNRWEKDYRRRGKKIS